VNHSRTRPDRHNRLLPIHRKQTRKRRSRISRLRSSTSRPRSTGNRRVRRPRGCLPSVRRPGRLDHRTVRRPRSSRSEGTRSRTKRHPAPPAQQAARERVLAQRPAPAREQALAQRPMRARERGLRLPPKVGAGLTRHRVRLRMRLRPRPACRGRTLPGVRQEQPARLSRSHQDLHRRHHPNLSGRRHPVRRTMTPPASIRPASTPVSTRASLTPVRPPASTAPPTRTKTAPAPTGTHAVGGAYLAPSSPS